MTFETYGPEDAIPAYRYSSILEMDQQLDLAIRRTSNYARNFYNSAQLQPLAAVTQQLTSTTQLVMDTEDTESEAIPKQDTDTTFYIAVEDDTPVAIGSTTTQLYLPCLRFYKNITALPLTRMLTRLIVHPSYRDKGIANQLLAYIEDSCKPGTLLAPTLKHGLAITKLYKSRGYSEVSSLNACKLYRPTYATPYGWHRVEDINFKLMAYLQETATRDLECAACKLPGMTSFIDGFITNLPDSIAHCKLYQFEDTNNYVAVREHDQVISIDGIFLEAMRSLENAMSYSLIRDLYVDNLHYKYVYYDTFYEEPLPYYHFCWSAIPLLERVFYKQV